MQSHKVLVIVGSPKYGKGNSDSIANHLIGQLETSEQICTKQTGMQLNAVNCLPKKWDFNIWVDLVYHRVHLLMERN